MYSNKLKSLPIIAIIFLTSCSAYIPHTNTPNTNSSNTIPQSALTGTCQIQKTKPYDANIYTGSEAPQYIVTIRNSTDTNINITMIASIFYNSTGQEITSDQQFVTIIIAPNQYLSLSFTIPDSLIKIVIIKPETSDSDEIDKEIVMANNCSFSEWSQQM
jgi:hypothetical protein